MCRISNRSNAQNADRLRSAKTYASTALRTIALAVRQPRLNRILAGLGKILKGGQFAWGQLFQLLNCSRAQVAERLLGILLWVKRLWFAERAVE